MRCIIVLALRQRVNCVRGAFRRQAPIAWGFNYTHCELCLLQTLLAATIQHWDSNQNKTINLPVAIVELIKEANASLEEWDRAIALFQVAGADAALKYIERASYSTI